MKRNNHVCETAYGFLLIMFSQKKRQEERISGVDGDVRQPLLEGNGEDLVIHHGDRAQLLFSAQDVEDSGDESSSSAPYSNFPRPTVRFEEEAQVIGPPLRSTMRSREAEFELDSDDFDESTLEESGSDRARSTSPRPRRSRQRPIPLLTGLMDPQGARRTPDTIIPMYEPAAREESLTSPVDIAEMAAKQHAGGNMFDSVANMANSILGAGIIGLPYAISQAGFLCGVILLVILCGVTDWTVRLVVLNAKLSGGNSYIEIMHNCFGPSGRAAVSLFQFTFAFGGMCAFGIIIGDTIPHVIRSAFPTLYKIPVLSIFTNRQVIITLCTLCVSYPLSLYRDIHKLSRASGLALLSMLVIIASVLIEGPHAPQELKGDPSARFTILGPGVFPAIGVISFAFVCHHNSLLIYGSLRKPTLDRFAQVTHFSTAISLVACCTLAISAFWNFTDKTQGNVLNNFPANNTLINVARFCFGLNMFTTLPLELFVCREVIEQYFFSHESFSPQRHLFFTTTIIISSMFLSLITCDLGVTLEITGGVSATALAFIFPAACYLKLANPSLPWYSRSKLPAATCFAFGLVVMVVSLFLALGKAWTREGEAKICV
ncbi:amino acid transporter [Pisolithus orientalis]|uniref:amino acid transporter n=1 Tax=Pisolithus orientalis TaxID=936130 RepID=UPI0022257659|nr:amino acid transporter [Pisolithus orientalis]KAI6032961.1 amino acid transporter [Pisolithus orientalis]